MNFLYTFVSSFFINYLVIWIVSLFNFKKRNLISLIIISVFNIVSIILNALALWELYVNIAMNNAFNEYLDYLLNDVGVLLGNIFAYIATLILLIGGRKIFKTRRQKQYLNAVQNKSLLPAIIAIILFILLGIGSLIYAIFISINFSMVLLINAVASYGLMLVFFGIAYYIFFINFTNKTSSSPTANINSNVINATIINKTKVDLSLLFILHLGNNKYYFKGLLDNNHTINYYLGHLLDVYVLTDFGTINLENEKVIVKGIKVDKIDQNLLQEIKLSRLRPDEKLLNVLSNFERYRIKNIYLDNNYNIVKIIEK